LVICINSSGDFENVFFLNQLSEKFIAFCADLEKSFKISTSIFFDLTFKQKFLKESQIILKL